MYDTYRRMMRAQRRGTHGTDAKTAMLLLALVGMGASAVHWWGIQSELTTNKLIAVGYTAILVLAPPILTSFLIPWSPGGMLLQKVNARTWGMAAVAGCALYLIYYSWQLQLSWWLAQPVVADSNLVYQQVLIGIIGFIIIPALLWAPVSDEELVEKVKQAHLVKRYEMQTRADIAILQATLLSAQQKAAIGFANLLPAEREELQAAMHGLIDGIDGTLQEIAGNLNVAAETVYGSGGRDVFSAPPFADDLHELLDYVAQSLTAAKTNVARPALAAPAEAIDVTHARAPTHAAGAHVDTRLQSPESREAPDDARRRTPTGDDAYLRAARRTFGVTPWTIKRLAGKLDISETSAKELRADWSERLLIAQANMGRWYFTESEAWS